MITPNPAADEERRRGLRRMRTLAVGLLLLAAVVYVLTLDQDGFLGFVNAGAEASMVGAIADWFAVTALFKHPLGLPIPHTALVPKRKDELGQEPGGVLRRELPAGGDHPRAGRRGRHLAAGRAVGWRSRTTRDGWSTRSPRSRASALAKVGDEQIADLVESVLVPRFREEPIAPLLGTFVVEVVRDDLHHGVVDLALEELHRWLVDNPDTVHEVLSERAPWWAPPRLNEAVTTRIHTETVRWIDDIRDDPLHHARERARLDARPARPGPALRRRHPGACRGA